MPHVFVGTTPRKKVSAAGAQLTYHGGPLLANVKLITIYWGSVWVADPLRTQLDEFADFFVSSSLLDQLAEYSVAGSQTIGHGTHAQTLLVTSDPPANLADADLQSFLTQQIANGTLEAPDGNTVYALFLPAGVTVLLNGAQSCRDFCGYHSVTPDGQIVYIVDTYDDCAGCAFAANVLDSSTAVFSHELCEAITDPHLDGWFDDNTGFEIGDICEPQTKVINMAGTLASSGSYAITGTGTADAAGTITANLTLTPQGAPPPTPPPPTGQSWVVQKEWSNAEGACV